MTTTRVLHGHAGTCNAPEAGTLPRLIASISQEKSGLAAHPTFDGCQLCLCVESQNGNGLAYAFAVNHPAAIGGLCKELRCECSLPVEAGEQFVTCTQFVCRPQQVGMDPL